MSKQIMLHIYKKRAAYLLSIVMMALGAALFLGSNTYAVGSITIAPVTSTVDNVAGATNARWTFTGTTTAEIPMMDVFQFLFPTGFNLTNVTTTGADFSGVQLTTGPGQSGVAAFLDATTSAWGAYGVVNSTTTSGTPFSFTLRGITNSNSVGVADLTVKAGTPTQPIGEGGPIYGPLSLINFLATSSVNLISGGSNATATISNVAIADSDTTGYGLDGRDFTVTWNAGTSTPAGYQFTQVFIVPSSTVLTTSNINTACGGPCMPVGVFNQYSVATDTLPQSMKTDSVKTDFATSTQYVAWVFVQATGSFIVSSSPFSATFDVVADTNAPQIGHIGVHSAKASTLAVINAFVVDDQTTASQFGTPTGVEYFKLKYGSDVSVSESSLDAVAVSGASGLFSFSIPTSSVPAAGNTLEYYLMANDASGNLRVFCANPNATTANDCKSSPFVIHTVSISSGLSVSGTVVSGGSALSGAKVFAGGFAQAVVTTDGSGNYTISGLPGNDGFDFTANKTGYTKASRMEMIGSSNKTGINMNIGLGAIGFVSPTVGGGGASGGAPHMVFSGPPDGMQGVPNDIALRVGFDQPLDASTVNDADPTDAGSHVYLTTDDGTTKIAGAVLYCANNSAAGCSALMSIDNNTILFTPAANLSTSTVYTLVISSDVKSQGGQAVQGNIPGGGQKTSFTTIGNSFSGQFNSSQWQTNFAQGGQFLPPFVKSMLPAPGMNSAPNTKILLEFNQAMDSATVNTTNITLWSGATQISSGVSVTLDSNEKRFVTINHSSLSSGEYQVKVGGAVASASGVPMRPNSSDTAFSSKFIVSGSADATAATIYPMLQNNSTGVATDKVFEFGFSESLSVDSVNSNNISLVRGSTVDSLTVKYNPGKNSVFVVPSSVLSPNTVYTITFSPSVTDLAGNGVATTSYTYTTGAADSNSPGVKDVRCDDFACKIIFSKQMNSDSQVGSKWSSSVINSSNILLEKTAPSSAVISLSGKSLGYDPVTFALSISGLSGLSSGNSFRVTVATNTKDISENLIATSSSENIFNGKVEDSKTTFGQFGDVGMFAPPTQGITGATIGGAEFKPQGFGSFTADQFALGQADVAIPFNPIAGADSNVFQVRFTPGVALQNGDVVALTFPDGSSLSSAAIDVQSPFYNDLNQFAAGIVTSTGISVMNGLNTVNITLGVSGSPSANDPLTIDLKKIINPLVPKSPQTGGYTVGIKFSRSGATIASKTSMPYFITSGGSNTLTVDVVAGSSTSSPASGANGTVYIHGGGPGGPMDKKLTFTNGDISAVDGTVGNSISYSNLPDGCYFVGTDPFITLGASDYFGQMSPEQVCLNSGESKTKWLLLSPASGGSTATLTVKMVDSNGDPYNFGGKDIDIFAGGPNKFVLKTLSNVSAAATNGYQLKLNADGHWFVGMGPAMSKGLSSSKPVSLGVMPPPSVDIVVKNIDTTPVLSTSLTTLPSGVSYSNGVVTFTFSSADKAISGTVKDTAGNGLANVEVFVHQQGLGASVFTQTNASGTFSLSVSDYGNYEIGAQSGGMPSTIKNIELKNESGLKIYMDGKDVTNSLNLTLKKAAYTISGKVLNGGSDGIAYAPVIAVDANGNSVFGQTGSDGSYTLFVDNGTWNVRAELPPSKTDACGTFVKTVTVSGSSQSSQNITSSNDSCSTLSGTVTVNSVNLSNVPLFIEQWDNVNNRPTGGVRKNTATDSSGAYSVKLGNGDYRIGTWDPTYGELSATTTVSGNTTKNVTVGALQDITFNFTGGTSAMNAFVELKNSTDSNKRISRQINGLNSSSAFSVPSGSTYNYFVNVFGIGNYNGTVSAGSSTTIDLGSSSDFITVTGTVYVDSSTTTGKSGVLVNFTNATTTVSAVTDDNGQYSIKLKTGNYTVADSLSGYVPTQGTGISFTTNTSAYDFGGASADQTSLKTASYTIEGTVNNSSGSAMSEGYVWASNASSTVVTAQINTDGSYSLPVTAGVWTIKAVGPLHTETTKSGAVTITNASQTGVNFQLTADLANVPTSTTGIVDASTGGSINDSAASGIKLTAGAGVLDTGSGDVTVNMEKNFTAPDTSNFKPLDHAVFSISASGDSSIKDLSGNAEIQIDFSSLTIPDGVATSNLKLAYYSPERGDYVPVEGGFTVDAANQKITGLVDHFTDFVIAYTPISSSTPSAPAGLSATAASASQINLSWTAVSGATSYTVYRSTDNITYSSIATPSTNSYNNTSGLSASTLYYYKVTATNGSGEGASSDAASATTQSSGGSGGGGGGASYTAPVVTATTTVVTTTTSVATSTAVVSTTVSVPSSSTVQIAPILTSVATATIPIISVSNPNSKIVIVPPTTISYQPGALIKFDYKYSNDTAKKVTVKVMRQLLDSKGKVVKSSVVLKTLKAKASFTNGVKENLVKNLKPGEYTVKVMILGAKNKVLEQNSFKIEVEKLKKKYFSLSANAPGINNISFDQSILDKVKSNVVLPAQLKLRYSYVNDSDQKQKIRMVRELVGPNGKVLQVKTGNWNMKPGEEDSQNFTQPITPNLLEGDYNVRIRAYDFTSKELLAENSLGFKIELK